MVQTQGARTPSADAAGVTLRWQSVTERTYVLERASGLETAPAFRLMVTNLVSQPGITSYIDTNALGGSRVFYRVRVEEQ